MTIADEKPVIDGDAATILQAAHHVLISEMRASSEPTGACFVLVNGGALVALDLTPEAYLDIARWALNQLAVERAPEVGR